MAHTDFKIPVIRPLYAETNIDGSVDMYRDNVWPATPALPGEQRPMRDHVATFPVCSRGWGTLRPAQDSADVQTAVTAFNPLAAALAALVSVALRVPDDVWLDACERAGVSRPCDAAHAALRIAERGNQELRSVCERSQYAALREILGR
jgi:hypothetical protein